MKLKKIIFIVLFVLFFLIINNNNIYAHSYDISNVDFVVEDYCIVEMSDNNTYLLTPSESAYYCIGYLEDSYNTIFSCKPSYSSGSLGTLKRYKLEGNTFVYVGGYYFKSDILNINNVIYSTCDIKYINHSDDIFFQLTPMTEVVIPTLETVEQIPKAIVETLKMIIPVSLLVFGMLLLIWLIKSLILRAI